MGTRIADGTGSIAGSEARRFQKHADFAKYFIYSINH